MDNNITENVNEIDMHENNDYHECPLCHEMFPVSNLFFHIMYLHPEFLAVWSSLINPNRQTSAYETQNINNIWNYDRIYPENNIINTINEEEINDENATETREAHETFNVNNIRRNTLGQYFLNSENEEVDDNSDYDFLLSLCDRIGYHKVGVKDINVCAPLISEDELISETIDLTNSCAICLEQLQETYLLRRISNCGHIYCGYCIETWFKNNKTCPVCKQDATYNIETNDAIDNNDYEDMPPLEDEVNIFNGIIPIPISITISPQSLVSRIINSSNIASLNRINNSNIYYTYFTNYTNSYNNINTSNIGVDVHMPTWNYFYNFNRNSNRINNSNNNYYNVYSSMYDID